MAYLQEPLASHGFIVVATKDYRGISSIIGILATRNDDGQSPLFGRVDTNNVGVFGLSSGGPTAASAATNDERVKAVMPVATTNATPRISVPSLFIAGTADQLLSVATSVFRRVESTPKYMAIIEAGHNSFGDLCGLVDAQPYTCPANERMTTEVTKRLGIAFFKSFLYDIPEYKQFLTNDYLESQSFPASIGIEVLQPGDANQDYVFDQMDIVQVQAAGMYLTGNRLSFREAW